MAPHDARATIARLLPEALVRRLSRKLDPSQALIASGILTMGPNSYSAPTVHLYAGDTARVRVGAYTAMANDVQILPGGNHRLETVASFPLRQVLGLGEVENEQDPGKGDVVIGSDVWIGLGARIVGGVTIGHGAVIAAWSTVTKDVPPYTLVAGNPARPMRRRFDDATIDALLRIAWWEWSEDVVRQRAGELGASDIAAFVARYDPDPSPPSSSRIRP
jgi:acetyltransferase-like isoleucine patch superfamily enzyme